MNRIKIFISSVQSEFSVERKMLAHYLRTDVLLGKFFEPFIFEEQPAVNLSPQQVYLREVEQCDIYLGIVGGNYGFEDNEGISPTEREYDLATLLGKHRLVFINSCTDSIRHPKEVAFVNKIEQSIVRKTFVDIDSLRTSVYAALVRYMEEKEIIRWRPFDAAFDNGAILNDIDESKAHNFILMARSKRNFGLPEDTPLPVLLQHLDLMDENERIANAALLLFGKKPQKFFPTSEVKCIQFYGNVMERPAPSYQIYKGDVFELVNQATSFVMSRINNWVGVRNEQGTAAVPTHPELPLEAVQEAIVNAICHRDYTSNGSVQVMLFRNRLEVWNPGQLPFGMTIENLYKPHRSLPVNPLLAEPMYWNGYIEKIGSGTEDMVKRCLEYGLRKPDFIQDSDFMTILWRSETNVNPITGNATGNVTGNATGNVKRIILTIGKATLKRDEIMQLMHLRGSANFRSNYLYPAINEGYVSKLYPESEKRPDQAYYLTEKGLDLLTTLNEDNSMIL